MSTGTSSLKSEPTTSDSGPTGSACSSSSETTESKLEIREFDKNNVDYDPTDVPPMGKFLMCAYNSAHWVR